MDGSVWLHDGSVWLHDGSVWLHDGSVCLRDGSVCLRDGPGSPYDGGNRALQVTGIGLTACDKRSVLRVNEWIEFPSTEVGGGITSTTL